MARRKKQEDTFIDQVLYPKLELIGIDRKYIKRNVSTTRSGMKRGDIWIADVEYSSSDFEERILCLIECKDPSAAIGDKDWQDATEQGQSKAKKQGLKSFFVTNTQSLTRCYNTSTLDEVSLDSEVVSDLQPFPVLRAIQTQVTSTNSSVLLTSFSRKALDPKEFRASLWNLRQIYRSRGISKGSEDAMIKTTLTFGILKLITEQQNQKRTLPDTIFLWDDWRDGQLDREIANTVRDLTKLPAYKHLGGCLYVDDRLDAEACVKIKNEFSRYSLYGSDFDFFGLIYEALANKEIKKDFGEFYTPRHLIRTIVRLRLSEETKPRQIIVCDPACGTGGFLVESFLYLQRAFELTHSLDSAALNNLRANTFHGYDTNDRVAIPFARTNMLMADDGGVNIKVTNDSLVDLAIDEYDYVLTNVPYGKYDGKVPRENFSFANARRYELLFVEKIIKSLKPGGKAAVIVPDGLVESTSNSEYRKKFLFEAELEVVVSLPKFVFEPYTTEKTYVLFFRKKRPSEVGRFQSTPVYHFIVDNDGFQDGKKRYPISENDLPLLEQSFRKTDIPRHSGFVEIAEINDKSYYSFCSEYYLRRPVPVEVSLKSFNSILGKAASFIESSSKE
ncbi:N-6 DNA methylase [Desulfobacterota bacterium AH_259_B03_O07]|nr:N-6 DNA methylase [Desulfobacterota bacterium AH_259_B03_O07]